MITPVKFHVRVRRLIVLFSLQRAKRTFHCGLPGYLKQRRLSLMLWTNSFLFFSFLINKALVL